MPIKTKCGQLKKLSTSYPHKIYSCQQLINIVIHTKNMTKSTKKRLIHWRSNSLLLLRRTRSISQMHKKLIIHILIKNLHLSWWMFSCWSIKIHTMKDVKFLILFRCYKHLYLLTLYHNTNDNQVKFYI